MQELGELQIPKIHIDPVPFASSYQVRLTAKYFPIVKDTPQGQTILEFLRKDPRVKALKGKMMPSGAGRGAFQDMMLAMWFLWAQNEHGTEKAREWLDSFLDSDKIPYTAVLWVLGMKVPHPITLGDDYTIRPIEEMSDSVQKEEFLRNAHSIAGTHGATPWSAITKSFRVAKALAPEQCGTDSDTQSLRELHCRMEEIAWLLNVLDGVCCVPFMRTGYSDSSMPFGPFGGWSSSSSPSPLPWRTGAELSNGSTDVINELLDRYEGYEKNDKRRILRVVKRLSQAKGGSQIEDQVLDLGIATEMLLLEDNSNHEQLALSFRLRGSWLLGASTDERKEIYGLLKELYTYRSQVAHSGLLCKGNASKMTHVRKNFPSYQALAERLCRKILKEGKPDWDRLILNVPSEELSKP